MNQINIANLRPGQMFSEYEDTPQYGKVLIVVEKIDKIDNLITGISLPEKGEKWGWEEPLEIFLEDLEKDRLKFFGHTEDYPEYFI